MHLSLQAHLFIHDCLSVAANTHMGASQNVWYIPDELVALMQHKLVQMTCYY